MRHRPQAAKWQMVDSFVFQIDWTIVAMVIGLLASLIAAFSATKMRIVRVIICVPLVLAETSVLALAQGSGAKMIFGQGLNSCGAWTRARQTKSFDAGLSAQWVAGYLSGMNMETAAPNALAGTDFSGLMAWIDNYCQSKPLDPIANATFMLMNELRARVQ
jgi:hypothetical protein